MASWAPYLYLGPTQRLSSLFCMEKALSSKAEGLSGAGMKGNTTMALIKYCPETRWGHQMSNL